MAKVTFGEYAAFETQGGIRFQKYNKLVKQSSVPPEVVAYLTKQVNAGQAVQGQTEEARETHPLPTEEEKARLREESMQVPPELERTEEEMAEARSVEAQELPPELTPDDFADEEPVDESTTPLPDKDASLIDNTFLESVSIHTAPLDAITAALYDRFGIYTVYLEALPKGDEINPITGEAFTKYHLGIAYQAAIRAQSQGILNRNPELARQRIDVNREASKNIEFDKPAANNFNQRTSVEGTRNIATTRLVHQTGEDGITRVVREDIPPEEREPRNKNGAIQRQVSDSISDEPIVEPNIRGGKGAVIRPNW